MREKENELPSLSFRKAAVSKVIPLLIGLGLGAVVGVVGTDNYEQSRELKRESRICKKTVGEYNNPSFSQGEISPEVDTEERTIVEDACPGLDLEPHSRF